MAPSPLPETQSSIRCSTSSRPVFVQITDREASPEIRNTRTWVDASLGPVGPLFREVLSGTPCVEAGNEEPNGALAASGVRTDEGRIIETRESTPTKAAVSGALRTVA